MLTTARALLAPSGGYCSYDPAPHGIDLFDAVTTIEMTDQTAGRDGGRAQKRPEGENEEEGKAFHARRIGQEVARSQQDFQDACTDDPNIPSLVSGGRSRLARSSGRVDLRLTPRLQPGC
jgi:hypothetical protein